MAERGNTTHGSNLDDQLKRETQGLVQGNRPTRAEDWREAETVDDGDNTPDGEQPVYVGERTQGEASGPRDDGGLTEPVADKAGSDDGRSDEEERQ